MADSDDVRRIAATLPGVVEVDSDGFDFRVAGRGFVWSYPERRPGQGRVIRTDVAVLFVGDEAEKQALLLGEPDLFFTTPGYDGVPLVMLRLAAVEVGRLAELVTDAHVMRSGSPLADDREGAAATSGAAIAEAGASPAGPSRAVPARPEPALELDVNGEIWFWRGPAPHHFVTVSDEGCAALNAVARDVTYGWGMIPVRARVGQTDWETSLFPKDGRYLVPMKTAARKAEGLEVGDVVAIHLVVTPRSGAAQGPATAAP